LRSSYAPFTHFINSTTQSSPPPTVEVADSEGATSSEKGEDSGNDEGDEGDEDNGESGESGVEEEWYESAEEYEREEKDGYKLEHEDNARLSDTIDYNSETRQASAVPTLACAVEESAITTLPAMPLDLPMDVDAPQGDDSNSELNPQNPGLGEGELWSFYYLVVIDNTLRG